MQAEDLLRLEEYQTHAPVSTALDEARMVSGMGLPILGETELLGAFWVGSLSRRRFTEQETQLLERLAMRAATAIEAALIRSREQGVRPELEDEERRQALASLTRDYERKTIPGIGIHAQADACEICQDAGRNVYVPAMVPPLPLVGCTIAGGCRCNYSAPGPDPRRRPPAPVASQAKLEIPSKFHQAARFGSEGDGGCRPRDLADYMDAFPLLSFPVDLRLRTDEVAYLVRPVRRTRAPPEAAFDGDTSGVSVPLSAPWRPWADGLNHLARMPLEGWPKPEDSQLYLTNWRLILLRGNTVESTLLVDIAGVECFRNGLALHLDGRARRLVLLVDDAVQTALYVAKAIADVASLAHR